MKKKKIEKVLSIDKQIEILVQNFISYRQNDKIVMLEPIHVFEIGEEVIFGFYQCSEIIDVFEKGLYYAIYLCSCEQDKSKKHVDNIRIVPWHDIHKKNDNRSSFIKNTEFRRYSFISLTAEDLIYRFLDGNIDIDPFYQRDYVWSIEDKILLIDSIFNSRDIGKIVLVQTNHYEKNTFRYEILDGKQRLNTLVEFRAGKFAYQGYNFEDLSLEDKQYFNHFDISTCIAKDILTDKQKIDYFIFMNKTGKGHSAEHIDKLTQLYNEII